MGKRAKKRKRPVKRVKQETPRPNFPPRLDIARDCKVGRFDLPTEPVFADSKAYPHIVWS